MTFSPGAPQNDAPLSRREKSEADSATGSPSSPGSPNPIPCLKETLDRRNAKVFKPGFAIPVRYSRVPTLLPESFRGRNRICSKYWSKGSYSEGLIAAGTVPFGISTPSGIESGGVGRI